MDSNRRKGGVYLTAVKEAFRQILKVCAGACSPSCAANLCATAEPSCYTRQYLACLFGIFLAMFLWVSGYGMQGLEVIHSCGLAHLDLKLNNVRGDCDSMGSSMLATIIDMGSARRIGCSKCPDCALKLSTS